MRGALRTALAALLVVWATPAAARAPQGAKVVAQQKAAKKKPARKPAKAGVSTKAPRKAGSQAAPADPAARASVAGQKVQEEAPAEAGAPELRELDDVLFPDAAEPSLTSSAAVRVVASGLPPRAGVAAKEAAPGELAWMASLARPDIPFRWDARLVRYLDYFKNNPKGQSFAAALVKRSGRYEAKIRAAAKARGVPEDLVWVALVESGMNPKVVSPAGAAGLWQFMPKAAKAYGLRMDRWVDERLDPERSTEAGLRYLKDLHARFGSWELALAAYNMGHGALLSSVRKYNTNDFWELSQLEAGVPYETALYVPKIVALAFVARNKAVFGCDGTVVDPPEAYETAVVGPGTTVQSVAAATGTPAPTITALNPQLVGGKTPPAGVDASARYEVRVPPGKADDLATRLAGSAAPEARGDLVSHTIRWGESLEHVATSRGTTEAKIRAQNGITDTIPPRPGTTLLVPKAPAAPARAELPVAVVPGRTLAPPGKRRAFYEVVWGDRIEDVARVLGVTVEDLCLWNNVDRGARLHGKMVLQAFVDEAKARPDVRLLTPAETKILVVGTTEFFDHFEAKNGRVRVVVTAQEGDTFASIAQRHGCTLGMLERINHRPRKVALAAGEQVVVYTRATGPKGPGPKAAPDLYEEAPAAREDLGG